MDKREPMGDGKFPPPGVRGHLLTRPSSSGAQPLQAGAGEGRDVEKLILKV